VGKTAVIGAIARKGNIVCQIIENTDGKNVKRFVPETVSDKVDLVEIDEHKGCHYLNALGYPHKSVTHSAGEYFRGQVHTANLDSLESG
jgi:ISXO2-like transposase domain